MIALELQLEGDGAFPDLVEKRDQGRLIHLGNDGPPLQVAGLSGGMASGRPSVMLRLDLPDGRTVCAETSLRLFLVAADALRARYGADL